MNISSVSISIGLVIDGKLIPPTITDGTVSWTIPTDVTPTEPEEPVEPEPPTLPEDPEPPVEEPVEPEEPQEPETPPAPDPEAGLNLTSLISPGRDNISSVNGTTVPGDGALNRDSNAVIAADFTGLDGSAGGLVFELGGTGLGTYVGFVENGDFHVRTGAGGSALPADDAGYLIVPAADAPAGDGTLVVELIAGTNAVRAWWNGEELGTPVARAIGKGGIAGGDRGTYLATGLSICVGAVAPAVSYTTASDLRYYYNQTVAL